MVMRRRDLLGMAGAGAIGAAIGWQQALASADDLMTMRARATSTRPNGPSRSCRRRLPGR